MVGDTAGPLHFVLEQAVILAPPQVHIFVIVFHVRAVNQVLKKCSDNGLRSGQALGLDNPDIRTRQQDFFRIAVAHVVMVVVKDHQVVKQGTEDSRVHEDGTAPFQGLFRHGEVHGLNRIVGSRNASKGNGNDRGIRRHLGKETVDKVGAGSVALPDKGFDALVNLFHQGVQDVPFEREFVLGRIDTDQVFGILAKKGFRANLAVHLDGSSRDGLRRQGDFVQGIETATATVLEDGSQVQVVKMGTGLNASLQADTGTGTDSGQSKGLNDKVPVFGHIAGQSGNKEVGNSRHNAYSFLGFSCR